MKCLIFTEPPKDFLPTLEVAGCYCEHENHLLFLKRHPLRPQGNTWGVPGGKLEIGETPRAAVIREIFEEVGLDIDDDGLVSVGFLYARLPHVDYIYHMFRKQFLAMPNINLALEEHLEAKWLTIPEVLQLPLIAGGSHALNYYIDLKKNNQK